MAELTPEQIYAQHRQMGLPEFEAALKARDAMRRDAEARSSFRDASDLFVGLGKTPQTGDALRTQLYKEADQPLADAQARAGARYSQALADPRHPANQALQALVAKHIPGAPQGLTVHDAEQLGGPIKMLADYAKQTAEAGLATASGQAINVKAPHEARKLENEAIRIKQLTPSEIAEKEAAAAKGQAEAGKTVIETKEIAPTAVAERGLKGAQTAETAAKAATEGERPAQVKAETGLKEAEAGKIKLETGGEVAPGWAPNGRVGATPEERKDFRTKVDSTKKITRTVDEILTIMKGRDFIANPKQRAQLQPRIAELTKALAHDIGQRGLPDQDIKFFGNMTGDATKLSAMNLAGLAENAERLKTIKGAAEKDLSSHAETHGFSPVGQQPQAAGLSEMKLSPSEEAALRKVASDPKDPRAAKAQVRLKMAGVTP